MSNWIIFLSSFLERKKNPKILQGWFMFVLDSNPIHWCKSQTKSNIHLCRNPFNPSQLKETHEENPFFSISVALSNSSRNKWYTHLWDLAATTTAFQTYLEFLSLSAEPVPCLTVSRIYFWNRDPFVRCLHMICYFIISLPTSTCKERIFALALFAEWVNLMINS